MSVPSSRPNRAGLATLVQANELSDRCSRSRSEVLTFRENLELRKRRFFDGLINSTQQDEAWRLSTGLEQVANELDALLRYRESLIPACEFRMRAVKACRDDYYQLIRDISSSGKSFGHSLPAQDTTLPNTINECVKDILAVEAQINGLVSSYNNLVGDLRRYVTGSRAFSQRSIAMLPTRMPSIT